MHLKHIGPKKHMPLVAQHHNAFPKQCRRTNMHLKHWAKAIQIQTGFWFYRCWHSSAVQVPHFAKAPSTLPAADPRPQQRKECRKTNIHLKETWTTKKIVRPREQNIMMHSPEAHWCCNCAGLGCFPPSLLQVHVLQHVLRCWGLGLGGWKVSVQTEEFCFKPSHQFRREWWTVAVWSF